MKKEKSPAYQWYPKDILTDKRVIVMTLEQECAYRRLLDYAWLEDGIDNDMALMASYCKMPGQVDAFKTIWKVIRRCFILRRGKWKNKRQLKERKKQKLYSDKQKNNANARWNKGFNGNANSMPPHNSGNALHLQSSSSISNKREGSKAARLSDFDFLESLKKSPAYRGINIDHELQKLDAWLLAHPGMKKSQERIVSWLNGANKPIGFQPAVKPPGLVEGEKFKKEERFAAPPTKEFLEMASAIAQGKDINGAHA